MHDDLAAICAVATDRFDLWVRVARTRDARRIAEIGVWQGEFAAHMLRGRSEIESYLLVDPWRPLDRWNKPLNVDRHRFETVREEALAATAFAGEKVTVMRGTSEEVVSAVPDGSLDLVYVDGDHTLRGITIDLMLWRQKVRPGGILAGDDYVDDPWHHGPGYEPTLVCPWASYFAEACGLPFVALPFRQYAIVNEPLGFSFTNLSPQASRDHVGCPSRRSPALLRTLGTRLGEFRSRLGRLMRGATHGG